MDMLTVVAKQCEYNTASLKCIFSTKSCETSIGCSDILLQGQLKGIDTNSIFADLEIMNYGKQVTNANTKEMQDLDLALQKAKGLKVKLPPSCKNFSFEIKKSDKCNPDLLKDLQVPKKCSTLKQQEKEKCFSHYNLLGEMNNKKIEKYLAVKCQAIPSNQNICENMTEMKKAYATGKHADIKKMYIKDFESSPREVRIENGKPVFAGFQKILLERHNINLDRHTILRLMAAERCKLNPEFYHDKECKSESSTTNSIEDRDPITAEQAVKKLLNDIIGGPAICTGQCQEAIGFSTPHDSSTTTTNTLGDGKAAVAVEAISKEAITAAAGVEAIAPATPLATEVAAPVAHTAEVIPQNNNFSASQMPTVIIPNTQDMIAPPVAVVATDAKLSPAAQAIQTKLNATQAQLEKLTADLAAKKAGEDTRVQEEKLKAMQDEIAKLNAEKVAAVAVSAPAITTALPGVASAPLAVQAPAAVTQSSAAQTDAYTAPVKAIAPRAEVANVEQTAVAPLVSPNGPGKAPVFDSGILLLLTQVDQSPSQNRGLTEEQKIEKVVAELYSKKDANGAALYHGEPFPWNGYIVVADKDANGKINITKLRNQKLAKDRAPAAIAMPISLPDAKRAGEVSDPTRLYQMEGVFIKALK
jgi:hypothetical protein